MKFFKVSSTVLIIFLFLITMNQGRLFAQNNFEGKIVYAITYSNLPPQMKGYENMLPKDITIHIKGDKSRVEQKQMMGSNIIVSDLREKTGFMEMDMGGQKLRTSITPKEFDTQSSMMPKIEYFDETKTIAGYPCKKAIMTDSTGTISMTVFYTEDIKNQAQAQFAGLKGFPLQYNLTQQNMTMEMIASVINEENVSEEMFKKSAGYQDITREELQKMMGGGN